MNIPKELQPDCLLEQGVFALLLAKTVEGDIIIRPIGGDEGYDITVAAKELDAQYPGCTMRLFEQDYEAYRRYFKSSFPKERFG